MNKLLIAFMMLCSIASAQSQNWECNVKHKTVAGKDFIKTWDLEENYYTHQTKDTIFNINMKDGLTRIFSLKKVKVKKPCDIFGFEYDKSENYCEGYINAGSIKNILKGYLPKAVLNAFLDTASSEELIKTFTDEDIVVETITFKNGYGERLNQKGSQNSFELTIERDDEYYFEATNGVLTKTFIKVNKRNNQFEMNIDATSWLDTYFEIKGECSQIQ